MDRFIVRDSDSRLNARDAFAVNEWIRLGLPVHSVHDHPNHERPLNGGLWGGRKGFLQEAGGAGFEKVSMAQLVSEYWNKDSYGADLSFLGDVIWPLVKVSQGT